MDTVDIAAPLFWVVFLVAALFYVPRVRSESQRPIAAYLIFVVVFSVVAFVLFATITLVLRIAGQADLLNESLPALVFLAAIFVPAFFAARWQVRKPPRRVGPH